jgi:hypothetical protein
LSTLPHRRPICAPSWERVCSVTLRHHFPWSGCPQRFSHSCFTSEAGALSATPPRPAPTRFVGKLHGPGRARSSCFSRLAVIFPFKLKPCLLDKIRKKKQNTSHKKEEKLLFVPSFRCDHTKHWFFLAPKPGYCCVYAQGCKSHASTASGFKTFPLHPAQLHKHVCRASCVHQKCTALGGVGGRHGAVTLPARPGRRLCPEPPSALG